MPSIIVYVVAYATYLHITWPLAINKHMRIAFVGKGGSGKSTLSALFSSFAQDRDYRVALFDVDVNSHTGKVLGLDVPAEKELSHGANPKTIRTYLKGENSKVRVEEFLKT